MISWGLATAAMVFVHTKWQFYGPRFLIGAMEAGFAPGVLYYLTLWFPAGHRERITSLLFLASAFSGLSGAPASGFVLGHFRWRAWYTGMALAFPAQRSALCTAELAGIAGPEGSHRRCRLAIRYRKAAARRADQAAESRCRRSFSLLAAFRTPGFLMLGFIYFLIQIASYGLNFWTPHLIRAAGTRNPTTIGLLSAIPYVCGAICILIVGHL